MATLMSCPACGKLWPENYCPECGQTIDRAKTSTANPPAIPPVLQPQAPRRLAADEKFPLWLAGQSVEGTKGMTVAEVQQAVERGGRFVIFPFCVSILVMTFKRSSPIIFIKPGKSTFAKSTLYILMSLFLGWWGIPWGPIWTISTLVTTLSGGKDVTAVVLQAVTGAVAAPPVLPVQPAAPLSPVEQERAAQSQRTRRLIRVTSITIVVLLFGWFAYKMVTTMRGLPRRPGELEFRHANATLSGKATASGNTEQAIRLASAMSRGMASLRNKLFAQSKDKSLLDEHDNFTTYCDLRPGQCVFLMHVPELRRFEEDAQKSLGELAWFLAQSIIKESNAVAPGSRLAVGLRGVVMYDRVLFGTARTNASEAVSGLQHTAQGFECEQQLYSWFVPQSRPLDPTARLLLAPRPAKPAEVNSRSNYCLR